MATRFKAIPSLASDADAEQFVDAADLSQYDLSSFKPMKFEFESKAVAISMRLPQALLDALKTKAQAKGIPYTRYVRMLIENDVSQPPELS
jgi:predicted DNA binding CopG/RHH family protein